MQNPIAVLDPQWRRLDELFTASDLRELGTVCELVWAKNEPMPDAVMDDNIERMSFYLSTVPIVDKGRLDRAPNLRAVIELYGAFPDTVDYSACFSRGVEVLSTGPGMRNAVAEMALAMALSGARGLVQEHGLFRTGAEHWLNDNAQTDFTLYGATVGFVGFGSIAKETTRLLQPFAPTILTCDPWLDAAVAREHGVTLVSLEELADRSDCLFVTAAPTTTNKGVVNAATIARLRQGALVVLVSRAHLVDFEALVEAARQGKIRAAIDVFPSEPISADDPLRSNPNVILSPHRAAAVNGGRQLMGRLVLEDIKRMIAGQGPANLARAKPETVQELAGVQHTKKLGDMADKRE